MVEPERARLRGMRYPVHILGQSAEEWGAVMPLGIFQKTLFAREVTEFLLLRGTFTGIHIPALHTQERASAFFPNDVLCAAERCSY